MLTCHTYGGLDKEYGNGYRYKGSKKILTLKVRDDSVDPI